MTDRATRVEEINAANLAAAAIAPINPAGGHAGGGHVYMGANDEDSDEE